uniref:Reverse transcriptase domain-containing protein n=1 Tax=Tanacetum cinerariifolium TaxID=118510 RepID=A0A6L2J2X4_TANCI|nr:hypothetical protein [Tanacetum cinerariifolium]
MESKKDTTSKDVSSSLLQSVKANALASKVSSTTEKDMVVNESVAKPSFSSVVHEKPHKGTVKIMEMRNEVIVNGVAVTLPLEAVESVNAHFVNTLYGYFIVDRLAFPLVENYVKNTWAKYGLKRIQLHAKFFLFQFNTREGMESVLENGPWLMRCVPLLLNEWTANTILKKDEIKHVPVWGRSAYGRAFIEIAADVELVKSLVIALPLGNKEGHTFATIDIEYEWTPPRCASCCIFDHVSDKCPKLPKVATVEKDINEGFTEVKKKKAKAKKNSKKQVEGIRLTKPPINLQYRRVDKGESSIQKDDDDNNRVTADNDPHIVNDSDSEDVDEYITMVEGSNSVHKEDTSIGSSALDITMREFKECVESMEVMDDCFLGVHAIFKPYRISDHSPSVLSIGSRVKVKPKPFKYFNVSILDKRFKDVVRVGWYLHVSGFHMFRVVRRLKGLKKPIWKLMYDKGNLHANVVRFREELDKLQTDLDNDLSNVSIWEKEAAAIVAFNEALLMEEKFLKQKAKVTWLKEGDSNTAYFHKMVKSRLSRSRIDVVEDASGVVFQNEDVAKAFTQHYEVFLGQPRTTTDFNINNLFPTRLNDNEAREMVRDISNQEVKSATFSMGSDKSPGLDGFTAAFFKDSWDIIGLDVTKAICEFFTNGRFLKELNHTIIALIPKVNAPARVNDYRPISCCNVIFKCISKIIANRLNKSLKKLVSLNQSAFVPGRSISDNILLTQEIMHNYHLDHGVPRCAFKVDIQKAYDTVDWDFLREVFTLMLHRRVRESSSFTYHRYCSELELINLCFADDLFLFAHGDVNSARIIKEALDEFKDASGLNLSMPKSKAYFYNVINHTKLAILYVLPFEEDHLSKNKSLSIAGRLQLIQSVLGSLNVFWALSRGKAKVAWKVVCLPKKEGGLGLVSLLMLRFVIASMRVVGVGRVLGLWESIRPRDHLVPWYDLVWFPSCVPRHAFHMWLIMKKRLKTQDVLSSWFRAVLSMLQVCWGQVHLLTRLFLFFCRLQSEVVDCIMSSVRLKVLSCRFKKSKDAVMFARLWELPMSMLK